MDFITDAFLKIVGSVALRNLRIIDRQDRKTSGKEQPVKERQLNLADPFGVGMSTGGKNELPTFNFQAEKPFQEKSYEEWRAELLPKLPTLSKLRASLSAEELATVIERERKVFDGIKRANDYKQPANERVGTLVDPFAVDMGNPFSSERETATKDSFGTVLSKLIRGDTSSLDSFKIGDSNYAGPSYGGARFLGKGEKFNKADLAVLPVNDLDLYSRDHDIRYQLISGVQDSDLRKRLTQKANEIYHAQIYSSDQLPLDKGDLKPYVDKLIEWFPTVLSSLETYSKVSGFVDESQRSIEAEALRQYDPERLTQALPETQRMYLDDVRRRWNIPVGGNPDAQRLLDEGYHPMGVAANTRMEQEVFRDRMFEGLMASGIPNVILSDPNVSSAFRVADVLRSLKHIRAAQAAGDWTVVNHMRNELYQSFNVGDIFNPDDWSRLPTPNQIVNRATIRETLGNPKTWAYLGLQAGVSMIEQYVINKRLQGVTKEGLSQDPVFVKMVGDLIPDYKRGNELHKVLAELIFRQGFGADVEYQALTPQEVEMYVNALEIGIPDDPVVATLLKLYPIQKPPMVNQEALEKETRETVTQEIIQEEKIEQKQNKVQAFEELLAELPQEQLDELLDDMRAFDEEMIDSFVEAFGAF